MAGGGTAVGYAVKCPVGKGVCAVGGFVIGTIASFLLDEITADIQLQSADNYEHTAGIILEAIDNSSNKTSLNVTMTKKPGHTIGANSPFLIHNDITIPDRYIFSVEGTNNEIVLSSDEAEFVNQLLGGGLWP